jgi:hypothetical protein
MATSFEPLSTIYDQVRHAWRRRVLPALMGHDPDIMLAALVVADASLDAVLLAEGYYGGTTGERVQNANFSFSNYAGLRAARHVRHQAVHRLDYHLCWCAAAAALDTYANALWEHGIDLSGIWYPTADAVDVWPAPVLLSPHNSVCGKGAAHERADAG